MKQLSLDEIQKLEFDILKEFDRICRKHNLRYTLAGGTLLGAVRHKGFIPWDDDIDVAMPRKDYVEFLKIAPEELSIASYKLHTPYDSYSRFSYSKLMDTRIVNIEFPHAVQHELSLYIDIFPLDGMMGNETERNRRKDRVDKLDKRLYRLKSAKYRKKEEKGIKKFIWSLLALLNMLYPKFYLIKKLDKMVMEYEFDTSDYVGSIIGGCGGYREMIKREEYEMIGSVEFEGCEFMSMKNTDLYLSNLYGDYMKLPPVEDRKQHENYFYWLKDTLKG